MSQQTFDVVSMLSKSKLHKLQASGVLDDDCIEKSWSSLCLYISRCLRSGRAVSVPKFGVFTFSSQQVNMEGTTNSERRDKDEREPVFMISKEFARGVELRAAVYRQTGNLRPLVLSSTSGRIQQTLCSFQEVAGIAGIEKDHVKYSVDRVIRRLEDQIRANEDNVVMIMPSLGQFIYRRGQIAIKFDDYIHKEVPGVLKLNVDERKKKRDLTLTAEKLNGFVESMRSPSTAAAAASKTEKYLRSSIEVDAQNYLKENLNVDAEKLLGSSSDHVIAEQTLHNLLSSRENPNTQQQSNTGRLYKKVPREALSMNEGQRMLEKLKYFLRSKRIGHYDLFSSMLGYIYGLNSTVRRTLDWSQFSKALGKFDVDLETDHERVLLFKHIDANKDGVIDLTEWTSALANEGCESLDYLRDVLMRNNIVIDDLLKTMGVNRDASELSKVEFKKALQRVNISNHTSTLAVDEIFKGKAVLPMSEIIAILTSYRQVNEAASVETTAVEDDETKWQENSVSLLLQIYRRIKGKLAQLYPQHDKHDKYLIEEFEKFDTQSQGTIDVANFKTCLLKANLGLSLNQIIRIARYFEKTPAGLIDYCKFSKKVNTCFKTSDDRESVPLVAEELRKWIIRDNLSIEEVILQFSSVAQHAATSQTTSQTRTKGKQSNRKKIRTDAFARGVAAKLANSVKLTAAELQVTCELIDIDKDGFIDKYDLETFLNRYSFLDTVQPSTNATKIGQTVSPTSSLQFAQQRVTVSSQSIHRKDDLTASKLLLQNEKTRLYPTDILSVSRMQSILSDLKRTMKNRRLSFFEVFQTLDANNDGFVNFDEFQHQIDQFVRLSSTAKEGLFAYFDHLKIGMFDFKRFAHILSQLTLKEENESEAKDSWGWQHEMLDRIRAWHKEKKCTFEESFRLLDLDFDGFISKEDLKGFLQRQFKISEDSLGSSQIDRLYKLLDPFKKGFIQKHDFAKALSSDEQPLSSQSATGAATATTSASILKPSTSVPLQNTLNVEGWMVGCCQQILLTISKTIGSLSESFEIISNHSNRIDFARLKEWITQTNALNGFNLTETLLQRLFAFLDPHKKGYLTESDWTNALKVYKESSSIPFSDLADLLAFTFPTNEEAMQFFLFSPNTPLHATSTSSASQQLITSAGINKDAFKFAINNLFKGVLQNHQVDKLWTDIHERLNISSATPITLNHLNVLFPKPIAKTFRSTANGRFYSSMREGNSGGSGMRHVINKRNLVKNLSTFNFNDERKSSSNQIASMNKSSSGWMNGASTVLAAASAVTTAGKTSRETEKSHLKLRSASEMKPQHLTGESVVMRLKNFIAAKGKDMHNIFAEIDRNDSGTVSNKEFRNAMMNLTAGFTAKDIDAILLLADPSMSSRVHWKKLLLKMQPTDAQKMLNERSKTRIETLKQHLYSYLISPKDAFKEFDEYKHGSISLEDFRYFLMKIARLSGEELPSFSISKDLFDFIDIKGDGVIDLDEWLKIFGGDHQSPSTSTSTTTSSRFVALKKNPSLGNLHATPTAVVSSFDRSADYDKCLYLIARNRKYITAKFDALLEARQNSSLSVSQQPRCLPTEQVSQVLADFLRTQKIILTNEQLQQLSAFAQSKHSGGTINYAFMSEVFKNRLDQQNLPPKQQ